LSTQHVQRNELTHLLIKKPI